MENFKNKIALVTGANRGIGKEIVLALAQKGATVVASGRNLDALIELCNDLTKKEQRAYPLKMDMENEESIKAGVAKVIEKFGKIDFLINNAGFQELNEVVSMSVEAWDKTFNVNMRGVFILTKEVLPNMIKNKFGKIISIGSTSGRRGYPEQAAYCASKHALVGFTKSLAYEVKQYNIGVSIVAPGGVLTDLSKNLRESRNDDGSSWITPKEVAEGVMYLLSQTGSGFTDELVLRRFNSEGWR